jgi:hypothetical protein
MLAFGEEKLLVVGAARLEYGGRPLLDAAARVDAAELHLAGR